MTKHFPDDCKNFPAPQVAEEAFEHSADVTNATWNYRIVEEDGECSGFSIREVYYDKRGCIISFTCLRSSPCGESLQELKDDFFKFAAAFSKPVVKIRNGNVVRTKRKKGNSQ